MTRQQQNLLFIMADEHQRGALGCYGHPQVQTPNLDRLAEQGTRFTRAYTNCPICVPSRASLATGQYVHQIGYWDNAFPYEGRVPSWGHHLQAHGVTVDSIGKLHYRRAEDDDGFSHKHDAMYVAEGIGELMSCIRANPPLRQGRNGILNAGPGDSAYLRYDRRIGDQACVWLADHAEAQSAWVLFVSFVCPHPPLIAPPELYDRYPLDQLALPNQWRTNEWPAHPALDFFRRYFGWLPAFDEAEIRRALATYYALCTHVDQQVGRLLDTLVEYGLHERTRVIYTADHGAMLGERGLFGKFTLYEESAGIPLIIAGPDVPANHVVATPVSLVDCYPTVLEAVGLTPPVAPVRPGRSLWQIASAADQPRLVFSEYHAAGSRHGMYMISDGQFKYIHYLHEPAQLFDLQADPNELVNLADHPDQQTVRQRYETQLAAILDPAVVDAQAKADQQAKLEAFGGEEAVLRRGLSNSPIPGEAPVFHQLER